MPPRSRPVRPGTPSLVAAEAALALEAQHLLLPGAADRAALGTPPADLDPVAMRRWVLDRAMAGVAQAAPGSVAYVQGLRHVAAAQRDLEAEQERQRPVVRDAAELSAEEWRERVLADTVATTLEDLELYVVEWLARHRFEMLIEQGMPRIVRRAS